MKKYLIIILLFTGINAFALKQDSIGIKNVNGKNYVMHKVSKGEGVYGLAKKYSVTAADIYASNEGADKGIKIDQVLLIPSSVKNVSGAGSSGKGAASPSTASTTIKTEKVYHTVASGQTLSFIAKKFNTNIAQIKTWNNLKSDNINLGQKLVVGEKKVTVIKPDQPAIKEETLRVEEPVIVEKQTPVKDNKIKTEVEPQVPENVVIDTKKIEKAPTAPAPVVNTYKVDDGDEVTEKGIASVSSEGELGQERSFILHPTAKIGTIMMITNPVNNSAVFVRVVGNCKAQSGMILKMSKVVADKLGVESNAEVTISYAK